MGNLTYAPNEIPSTLAVFDTNNGVPLGHGFVAMHKGYLVVPYSADGGGGNGSAGFAFFNVSNPRALAMTFTTAGNPAYASNTPNYAGNLSEPHGYSFTRFNAHDYVCFTQNINSANASGIQVWDFTDMDTPAPTRVSQLGLQGLNGGDYAPKAWWVFWQGGRYAYVAGSSGGLYIVDVSNPAAPVLVTRRTTSQLGFGTNATNVVFAVGNLLVLTGAQPTDAVTPTGLATYDISDPANPVLLDYEPDLAGYSSMVNGNRIYGARDPARVWSIADPTAISLVGIGPDVATKGGYGMVQDDFFLYGSSSRYVKLNIASLPFTVAHTNAPAGFNGADWDFAVPLGNLVFQGNDHSGSALVVHQAAPDTTGPLVNMVNPAPDSVNRAITSRVGLTFTDAIDLRSVDSTSVIVRPVGGAALAGRYSHQTGIVNFWPDQPLQADTVYEIVLPAGGVKDYAGNGLASGFTSLFSTGAFLGATTAQVQSAGPVTPGTAAAFTATATGVGTLLYSWDFGDGTPPTAPSTSATANHVYAAPGHYAVTVNVTAGTGNASASLTQTVHHPLTATAPTRSGPVIYDAATNRVWCVNPDADTVTALDGITYAKLLEIPVGRHPRTLARAPGGEIWVVTQEDATIHALHPATGALTKTIPLPRGSRPYGLAFSPDSSAAWVSTEGTGNLLKLDPASGALLGTATPGGPLRGIAVSGDSARVFVTRFISPDTGGEVHEIDPATLAAVRTLGLEMDTGPDTEASSRGLPNYLVAATITPDGRRLWVPSKKDNIQRGLARDGLPLTFESSVRTIASQIDLVTNAEISADRIDFNDREMAHAIAFSPLGDYAFVALQGSNTVDLIDAYTGSLVAGIEDVGRAPQGLVLNPAGTRLYVQNFMDRSVAVYDTSQIVTSASSATQLLAVVPTVATEPLTPEVLQGKRIFYDATDNRMNHDGYLSCASCHLDGGHDGRTWDFTDRGEGLRNTISLHGRGTGHGRMHWSGNFDEVQDFENDIRGPFGGDGFLSNEQFTAGTRNQPLGDPKAGLNADLDALAAYLASLTTYHASPHRAADGSLTAAAVAGRRHFGELGCYACHSGTGMTDSETRLLHDTGTLKPASGNRLGQPLTGLDTPTLKALWETPPYLHDGSAATLAEVLTEADPAGHHGAAGTLTPLEKSELVAYLLQLDGTDSTYDFTPLARMTEPVPGAAYAVGGAVPLAVHVADHLGAVAKVEFFHGATKVGEKTSPPFVAASVGVAGTNTFHAVVHFTSGRKSETAPVNLQLSLPLPTIRVNFQPPATPVPADYLPDTGAVFADRGNGHSYGWNAPTTETRDRNNTASPDQRHDTFNHLQKPGNSDAVWEIAVPNGSYQVHIVSGDADFFDGTFRTTAEGVLTVNGTPTTGSRWVEGTQDVTVSDGRLTVRSGAGANNNKICFIDIVPLTATAATAVSLAAITPLTAEGSAAPGVIRLTRTGDTTTALPVHLAFSGTATAGADYQTLAEIQTIPAGEAGLDIAIQSIADAAAEGAEILTLSLLQDPAYGPGATSTATVTISDHAYDDWRFATFRPLVRIDDELSGFTAAPGDQGFPNGLAYALGFDPADPPPAPTRAITDAGHLALTFTRPEGLGGVSYRIEASPTLSPPWTVVPEEDFITGTNGDGTETVIVRDPLPLEGNPRRFLRLGVSRK